MVFFISLDILFSENDKSLIASSAFFPTIDLNIGESFLVLDLIFLFTALTVFKLLVFLSFVYFKVSSVLSIGMFLEVFFYCFFISYFSKGNSFCNFGNKDWRFKYSYSLKFIWVELTSIVAILNFLVSFLMLDHMRWYGFFDKVVYNCNKIWCVIVNQ